MLIIIPVENSLKSVEKHFRVYRRDDDTKLLQLHKTSAERWKIDSDRSRALNGRWLYDGLVRLYCG
jgi:hypothetical protein